MNIKYLSHSTRYSYTGNGNRFSTYPCWGSFFGSDIMSKAIKSNQPVEDCKFQWALYLKEGIYNNNYCMLPIEHIQEFLEDLQKVFKFKKFEINPGAKDSEYIISMDFGINHMPTKILLTLCRYLYEYPGNIMMKEASNLRKAGIFPNLTFLQLFTLVSNVFPFVGTGHTAIVRRMWCPDVYESYSIKYGDKYFDQAAGLVCFYDAEELARRIANYPLNVLINFAIPVVPFPKEYAQYYKEWNTTQELVNSIEAGELSDERIAYYILLVELIKTFRPNWNYFAKW